MRKSASARACSSTVDADVDGGAGARHARRCDASPIGGATGNVLQWIASQEEAGVRPHATARRPVSELS
jgi:hypothetical protein